MREPFESLLPCLRGEVRRLLGERPQCHGWDHTVRVWRNARRLCRVENGDDAVVEYGALLHDIARAEEDDCAGAVCHAARGAQLVPGVLRGIGVRDESFARHVAACVSTHRYRRRDGNAPATLEARIVFDADKLDSIGAIGIGRAFHFAGGIKARVHNAREEALRSESYSREDSAYREFLVKLRHLRSAMLTPEGRRIADERHRFMCEFFERLNDEAGGKDYAEPES
jgi:uncharacterized protein